MVGAQGPGLQLLPVGDVQDAKQVGAELRRVYHPRDEVASLHHQAYTLPPRPGDAGLYNGLEYLRLGDGPLKDVVIFRENGVVKKLVGVKGMPSQQRRLVWRQVAVYGRPQEPGADVVGQPQLTKKDVAQGGFADAGHTSQ